MPECIGRSPRHATPIGGSLLHKGALLCLPRPVQSLPLCLPEHQYGYRQCITRLQQQFHDREASPRSLTFSYNERITPTTAIR